MYVYRRLRIIINQLFIIDSSIEIFRKKKLYGVYSLLPGYLIDNVKNGKDLSEILMAIQHPNTLSEKLLLYN